MRIYLLITFTIIIFTNILGQDHILEGMVYDYHSKQPLEGAKVEIKKSDRFVLADSSGIFSIAVPRNLGYILISHPGYYPDERYLKPPFWKRMHYFGLINIDAKKRKRDKADSNWIPFQNALYFHPFELIIGSLGLQYERFFGLTNAAGIHASCYFAGWGYSVNNRESVINKYSGFKITPYYRYYTRRWEEKAFFVELKAMFGYFDLHPLIYKHYISESLLSGDNITTSRNVNFWTGGGGLAIGFLARLPKSKKGIFSFSGGIQAFPLRVPSHVDRKGINNQIIKYNVDEIWWYLGGPGSVIQVKVAYGKLF